MSDIEKEREAFEAWGKKLFYIACFERDEGGSYVGRGLNGAWLGWQARSTLSASPAPSAEVEAVEVVARLLTWRGPKHQPVPHGGVCARHYAEYPENHYPDGPWAEDEPLMTVAQHRRIVAAKDAEISRLRVDNEALAANLRGKHSTTGATYTHLIAERDELRAQLAAQQAAVPVGICDSMMLSGEVCKLPAGHDGPCGYYAAPAAPQQEPMAEVGSDGVFFLRKQPNGEAWPRGTKLYAAAPQQCVIIPRSVAQRFFDAVPEEADWAALEDSLNADRSAQGEKP